MSLPLLQTSPSVQLEIGTDRQLRADLVLSPDPSNALRINTDGVYAKKGQRRFPWWVNQNTAQALVVTAQTQQVLAWGSEAYDPDGLFDLVGQPTRITFSEAQRYFSNLYVVITLLGGTAVSMSGELMLVKNGTTWVGGTLLTNMTAAGITPLIGTYAEQVDVLAGDYLEAYFRFLSFTTLTATSATFTGNWGGGAITT